MTILLIVVGVCTHGLAFLAGAWWSGAPRGDDDE